MTRSVHVSYAQERTLADAKKRVRYMMPGWRVVSGRRVDRMDVTRGFIVVVTDSK